MTTFNILLTLHPVTGASFDVAADDAVSATAERSGGALLATVAVDGQQGADELCAAARAHFTAGGHQPDSMAQAVAAVDRWLSGFNADHGTDHRLDVRPGILKADG
ncbi:hypothetical protein [Streptomyces europaeiscabiei]|uniref:hypothetical protein n=1 Tax=Streptomyces europaeiscabiei TaxID=146819 RepID=UPI0029B7BD8A|nr:hypothetical protein [Streptomyces europaeiscabiei]MDX3860048.1 hypothetical protein [Streptomyces europaeiscabiei]